MLGRTDFGEADRIITFLTPDHGKVRGVARGVRKQKSKLAGGIELFSVSDVSFLVGKGELYTVMSTRLQKYYSQIVNDLDRSTAAFEFIKLLNKATEEHPELDYFDLLNTAFAALDNPDVGLDLIYVWFSAQLLRLAGQSPDLRTEPDGTKLVPDQAYDFNFDAMAFRSAKVTKRSFNSDHIKFLRLIFSSNLPTALQKVQGSSELTKQLRPLLQSILSSFVQI